MNQQFTLQEILTSVCDYYQITQEELIKKNRKTIFVKARQIYCYLAREFSKSTVKGIIYSICRDNSTVIYSINKISIEKDLYPDVKKDIEEITAILFREPKIVIRDINLLKICDNKSDLF